MSRGFAIKQKLGLRNTSVDLKKLENMLTFDRVVGILVFADGGSDVNSEFPIGGIYYAFFKLKEKYPAIFRELDFTFYGRMSYGSKRLEGLFFQLGAWGNIGMSSREREYSYTFKRESKQEAVRDLISIRDSQNELRAIAKDFDRFIEEYINR